MAEIEPETVEDASTELARSAIAAVSPGELEMFTEVADEYWDDPDAAVRAADGDVRLGFGIDLAVLAPYAIAIAFSVVQFIARSVLDAAAGEAKVFIAARFRKLFQRDPNGTVPALTVEQRDQVRAVAIAQATRLGLADDTSTVLADAIVGGILSAPKSAKPVSRESRDRSG